MGGSDTLSSCRQTSALLLLLLGERLVRDLGVLVVGVGEEGEEGEEMRRERWAPMGLGGLVEGFVVGWRKENGRKMKGKGGGRGVGGVVWCGVVEGCRR